MKKVLTLVLVSFALLFLCENSYAQRLFKNKSRVAQLEARIDSLQKAYDSLYVEYQALLQPVNGEGDDNAYDESEPLQTIEYNADNIDSLLNLYYVQKMMDVNEVNMAEIDRDTLMSNIPDSVYVRRLENMGSFIPVQFNRYVKNSIILYTERLSITPRILGLYSYYGPIMEEIFDEYNLPKELVCMAIIESAFNPKAVSRARAKGMWQFMYGTAKSYGLTMNSFVEERFDPVASCHAAAKYLRDSYMVFGDWSLAIASYNCGTGNVNKAIRRSGGKTDFWSVYQYLPRETRGYFPAFIAALYTLKYYREHAITPAQIALPAHVDTFHVNRMLHFNQISEVIGVPVEQLRDINPQYVHDIIPGNERTYILNIPYSYTNAFADKEEEIYKYKDTVFFNPVRIKHIKESGGGDGQRVVYKVKSGDNLGSIARRYRTTVANIKRWNGLKNNNLRVGQRLYIYGSGSAGKVSSEDGGTAAQKSTSTANTKDGYVMYTIKKGDTLSKIASRYGVSLSSLYKLNNMNAKSTLQPGKKIRIKKAE